MRFRTRILIAVAMVGSFLPVAITAQMHPDWYGTWTLDLQKSTYAGPAPYRRGTLTIEPSNGGVKTVYDLVRVRGGITHMEWTGALDGRDYSVQGLEEFITYAYSPIDERTYEVVMKVDLVMVARSVVTLTTDGRTITTVTKGRNAQGLDVTTTTVYRKEP